ncbi:MAG: prepilin-type N-terminal cleavage/methylation domain-containing protein [Clostridiales bacterium]|nr:prepilin-type N-terminal cleavage/methylation domain-containing protein [Clostridiales bacterium]
MILSKNKGFTLIELLIALAILLIISSAFLALYVNSYRDITRSGMNNRGLYEIQERLEQSPNPDDTSQEKELIISFPDLEKTIRVSGRIQTESIIIKDKELSISVFVPD